MNTIQLYKFINNNEIEWKWSSKDNERDVIIFVPTYLTRDFCKLFTPSFFADSGFECTMMNGYFVFWMLEVCDYYDIDTFEVFGNDPEPSKQ